MSGTTDPHGASAPSGTAAGSPSRRPTRRSGTAGGADVSGRGLLDAVGAMYDAAAEEAPWSDVSDRLSRLLGARTAALWTGNPAGAGRAEALALSNIPDGAVAAYAERFHALDPWFNAMVSRLGRGGRPEVVFSHELVPPAEYGRGEFYLDYARAFGIYHALGAVLPFGDGADIATLALHRPEGAEPFGEAERRVFEASLPHLRGALRLRRRLGASAAGAGALDASPVAAFVADAASRVLYANAAAERLAAAEDGVRFARAGPRPGAPVHLAATGAHARAALTALVRAAALRGAPATGLRLARAAGSASPPLAALVAPLPARLVPPGRADRAGLWTGGVARLALVLVRDPCAPAPPPALLAGWFGLTPAEAATAHAMAGGVTAEAVAALRGVGLDTVRTQLRSVLGKTGAVNLRDLERLLAALPAVAG